jgi:photosystem II stability/assembly factor-like uncharacterized protein
VGPVSNRWCCGTDHTDEECCIPDGVLAVEISKRTMIRHSALGRTAAASALLTALWTGCASAPDHVQNPRSEARRAPAELRREWMLGGLQGRDFTCPVDRFQENRKRLATARGAPAPPIGVFDFIGPRPIQGLGERSRDVSGRVAAVAVDPTAPTSTFLAGAASGGIWRTDDGGLTWQPRTDDMAHVLAIAAIAFSPSLPDRVYAATGDYAMGLFTGVGLLRSDDGGLTWDLGLETDLGGRTASAVGVHPTDPDRVWVATHTGLVRTTDGGLTAALLMNGRLDDLERRPDGDGWYVAGTWGGASERLRRSFDGESWAAVHGPWESMALTRFELAAAPSSPNTLYLLAAAPDGSLGGLWRTDDAWSAVPNWAAEALPPPISGNDRQANYDLDLLVDPDDPDILYLGQVNFRWLRDGTTWWTDSFIHDDQHAMAVSGSNILVGHDGGVQLKARAGTDSESLGRDLEITQFYFGDASPTASEDSLGGTQDNGSVERSGELDLTWRRRVPGDGGRPGISRVAPDLRRVATNQGSGLWRTTDGATWASTSTGIDTTGKPFVSQIILCPADDEVALFPTDNLWRTQNLFSATPPNFAPIGPEMGAEIRTATYCAADLTCSTFALGTVDGRVRVTVDGGASWHVVDPPLPGPRAIGDLEFADGCEALWVAISGFSTPGLFRARDLASGSPTFEDHSPPVDTPCRAFAESPSGAVFLGTDMGLFHAPHRGASWRRIEPDEGLPTTPVFDLVYADALGELAIFTYGRGAWRLTEFAVFNDGFESGDPSGWTSVAP